MVGEIAALVRTESSLLTTDTLAVILVAGITTFLIIPCPSALLKYICVLGSYTNSIILEIIMKKNRLIFIFDGLVFIYYDIIILSILQFYYSSTLLIARFAKFYLDIL